MEAIIDSQILQTQDLSTTELRLQIRDMELDKV
jgi:hypothetical protein